MLVRAQRQSSNIVELVRLERRVFAAKLRTARALLNWSQSELADRVGLTQRAIHKLEQGETEPRRATVHAVEAVLRIEGLSFDEQGGGFRLNVDSAVLDRATPAQTRRRKIRRYDLGVTREGRLATYRA
ncbi:MAG: helix-turn-helix transcriptional regulator [Pseudolabrys sp.]